MPHRQHIAVERPRNVAEQIGRKHRRTQVAHRFGVNAIMLAQQRLATGNDLQVQPQRTAHLHQT